LMTHQSLLTHPWTVSGFSELQWGCPKRNLRQPLK
jgi:hypothetical protein